MGSTPEHRSLTCVASGSEKPTARRAHRPQACVPGSARVPRVGESVPFSRTFRNAPARPYRELFRKDCFGETPKPAPESGALPGSLRSLAPTSKGGNRKPIRQRKSLVRWFAVAFLLLF